MIELVMLFAFAVVMSIVFNFGAPRFAATKFGQRFVGNYAMVTLGTAIVFFVTIYVAALLMSAVKIDAKRTLPTVGNPIP